MKKPLKITLTLSITIVMLLGFVLPLNPAGNWYQQFMPNIGGRSISDITFIDSLTGYCITSRLNDTSFVLKTTDSGDSWSYNYTATGFIFSRIQFLNQNTGFAGGTDLIKTTNGGINWLPVNTSLFFEDMTFISNDTGWFAKTNSLTGGVFFTSNGGVNWQQQINLGSLNPNRVYFFDGKFGFISKDGGTRYLRRTTDSGQTWNVVDNNDYFMDMYFADTLMGWKCSVFGMKKTINGGLNWTTQTLPYGGIISSTGIQRFTNINRDTIWGVGGYVVYPNNQIRGMLYRTTNGGDNWLFQIPDTGIHIGGYSFITFIDKDKGWAYNIATGIHTINGGDTNFVVGLQYISGTVPSEFMLYQNYPNPFNPTTRIKYQIIKSNLHVVLSVFDITGRHLGDIVNQRQNAGTYEVDYNASAYSSGVYFYSMFADGILVNTKKMILVK